MKQLIQKLNSAAGFNSDQFEYIISVEYLRKRDALWFTFSCIETADRHTILIGSGTTPDEAIETACENLKDKLQSWGYKMSKD